MSRSISWTSILDCTERGARPTLSNAVKVLQKDPLWNADRLWYDEFLDCIFWANSPTRAWRDEDDYRLTVYMQETATMTTVADHLVAKAVRLVAKQRTKHVVRDWLVTLQWDGVPRIATAFEDYWGADKQPVDYLRAASANFFIGLIARVFRPGCKLDTMPVFEGVQGIRKSSALDLLGGAWYAVISEAVSSKDFLQSLRGKWLLEISELQSFSRSDVAHVKSMMSTRSDNYRPSYGRVTLEFPRQSAFAGTVNADDWGTDDTGLRRFWPVSCGAINLDLLAKAREQLFAEAVHLFHAGATWWDMPATTAHQQAERQQYDDWTDAVLAFCGLESIKGAEYLTVAHIAGGALKLPLAQLDKSSQMRLARILRLAGWSRKTIRDGSSVLKVWTAPGGNVETENDVFVP